MITYGRMHNWRGGLVHHDGESSIKVLASKEGLVATAQQPEGARWPGTASWGPSSSSHRGSSKRHQVPRALPLGL